MRMRQACGVGIVILALAGCGGADEGEPEAAAEEGGAKAEGQRPGLMAADCGASPREAPTLEPGHTYADTISGSEKIYCAFEVEPGRGGFELIMIVGLPRDRECGGGYLGGTAAYEVVDESAAEVLPGPPGGGSEKGASKLCEGGRDESSNGEVIELPGGRHFLELRVDCAGAGASCGDDAYPIEFTISAPY